MIEITSEFSLETMHPRENKCLKIIEKNLNNLEFFIQQEPFRNGSKIFFSDKKLKQFITRKPELEKMKKFL
jgi:hypothetical protein